DIALDEPWRHLALRHLVFHRARPRPRVLVRQERHRRDRIGTMALRAGTLQDRRDILGERHLTRGSRPLRRNIRIGAYDCNPAREQADQPGTDPSRAEYTTHRRLLPLAHTSMAISWITGDLRPASRMK